MEKITRKEQAANTKRRIAKVLEELMYSKKMTEITIKDICSRAHIAAGTFYVHFSCKEEAILYIYRNKDSQFRDLILGTDHMKNIELILSAYYNMVNLNQPQFNRQLYICHLTYYDPYFFSEDRAIFQILKQELDHLGCHDTDVVWKLLRFCRGEIYNYCISFEDGGETWKNHVRTETLEYLTFLLKI